MKKALWMFCFLSLALTLFPRPAQSAYPTKPVEMIIGFGPGGAADVAARLVASYVSQKWGQPINVINMPGASGIIGTRHVLTAKPDGYTLMMDNHAVSAMLAASQMDLPFKWENRTTVGRVTVDPVFYTVKEDSPWKSLKEVSEHIRKNPKVVRWGIAGVTAVGAHLKRLPLSPAYDAAFEQVGWQAVLAGGDDYELCFTIPPAQETAFRIASAQFGVPCSYIGDIEAEPGLRIVDEQGVLYAPEQSGFDHFRVD